MGYAFYQVTRSDGQMIDAGYGVRAVCEAKQGCTEVIDRGLGYLCGTTPGEPENGCGGYFCGNHLFGQQCEDCVVICQLPEELRDLAYDAVRTVGKAGVEAVALRTLSLVMHQVQRMAAHLDQQSPEDSDRPQAWLDGFSDGCAAVVVALGGEE
jgi:hypothetical protein